MGVMESVGEGGNSRCLNQSFDGSGSCLSYFTPVNTQLKPFQQKMSSAASLPPIPKKVPLWLVSTHSSTLLRRQRRTKIVLTEHRWAQWMTRRFCVTFRSSIARLIVSGRQIARVLLGWEEAFVECWKWMI